MKTDTNRIGRIDLMTADMKTTQEKINEIRAAQILAAEWEVIKGLREKGLIDDEKWGKLKELYETDNNR